MLKDHGQYLSAVAATTGMHQILHELCHMHARERAGGGGRLDAHQDAHQNADCRSLVEAVGVGEALAPPALLRAFEAW